MSSAKRNAKNLAINWFSFGATGVVTLFLSPFVIQTLGAVEYGIWSLINVLAGYMGIVDLGVRASTGRFITLYIGREDHDAVDSTIRTSLGVFSVLGILVLIAGALLGSVFPYLFTSVPQGYHRTIMWLVPLMAANVWISMVAGVFSSVLLAHERFDLSRGVDLFTLAIRTAGTVFALYLGYGIIGLALVVVFTNLIPLACNLRLSRRVYKRLRYWPLILDRQRLRELSGYGLAAFVITIASKIIGQTDLIIAGGLIDVSAVTVYTVGAMLVYYCSNLLLQINTTFAPALQKTIARGEMGAARWIFYRQVRLGFLLGVPVFTGFVVYGEAFIRLWMLGPRFNEASVQTAAIVMGILSGSRVLSLFTIGSISILKATGHVRFTAIIKLTEAFANLALSLMFVLVFHWGLCGIALATFVSRLMVSTLVLPWYACIKAKMDYANYLTQVGLRGIVAIGLFAVWCYACQLMVPCATWLAFALSVCLATIGYLPIALLILVPESDRSRVQNRIRILWT